MSEDESLAESLEDEEEESSAFFFQKKLPLRIFTAKGLVESSDRLEEGLGVAVMGEVFVFSIVCASSERRNFSTRLRLTLASMK